MKIFDAHCDVLYKMYLDPTIQFENDQNLHVHYQGLKEAGVAVQIFAIYIPESTRPNERFIAALHMIDIFYKKVIAAFPAMKFIRTQADLEQLQTDDIGAMLTLEGCDCIGEDPIKLKTLLRLGVSAVGLTWNVANAVADGVMEERGAGLSRFGKDVVQLLNEHHIACDVSHLSDAAFWDVVERATYPFASHSNCRAITPHPRNLTNSQLKVLIEKDSVVGLTFVPEFLTNKTDAYVTDILFHLEHICNLGGENNVGFGSDFDGIEEMVTEFQSVKSYNMLVNELVKRYSNKQVKNFLFHNMASRIPR